MTRRTALALDGRSGIALATVRSLGRAGWRVLSPAGTRSAASRFASATVPLPCAMGEGLGFPCVVKPRHSYVRDGERMRQFRHLVVDSPAGLRSAFAELTGDDPPLIQRLAPGRAMSVGAVRQGGRLIAAVARETL